ncbi:MAG: hypothetical protein AB1758_17195, partial [Candidatus Eremiobacterota bacterium]
MTPIYSPWSRELAARLIEAGLDVHLLDFEQGTAGGGYLKACAEKQHESIQGLLSRVTFHPLRSRLTSALRHATCAPQVARIGRACKLDALLPLNAGGFALTAFLSGFRP